MPHRRMDGNRFLPTVILICVLRENIVCSCCGSVPRHPRSPETVSEHGTLPFCMLHPNS